MTYASTNILSLSEAWSLNIDAYTGTVEHIGIKTTRLRSEGGEQIILSNADILKSRVRNYGRMTEQAKAALAMQDAWPRQRLAAFVTANLNAPIIDARVFSLWATFLGRASADPTLARAHREGYLGFRNEVEAVVAEVLAAEQRKPDASRLRHHAIAINAIIDGLWIEGCLAGEMFSPGELAAIGVKAVEAELGLEPERGENQ